MQRRATVDVLYNILEPVHYSLRTGALESGLPVDIDRDQAHTMVRARSASNQRYSTNMIVKAVIAS